MNSSASRLWALGLWIVRIIIACRVSILSAAAGIWIFSSVPQARDLFADISFGPLPKAAAAWQHWIWFFVVVVFIWAIPIHYAARRMLYRTEWMFSKRVRDTLSGTEIKQAEDSLKQRLVNWIDWIPRFLGIAPFIAIYIGLQKTASVITRTQALGAASDAMTQIALLRRIDLLLAILFFIFLVFRRPLISKIERLFNLREHVSGHFDCLDLIAFSSAILTVIIFGVTYFAPFAASDLAPRAIVVPLIFGSSVFLATFLAWIGDSIGFPVLSSCIVLGLGVTAFHTHFDDIREFNGLSPKVAHRQIDLDAAISQWKKANGCDNMHCPPALIVAAEGGASRAAFAAVTAIGFLLDHTDRPPATNQHAIARRIFMISGVSGGAFGAAIIRTALWESPQAKAGQQPPCRFAPRTLFIQAQDVRTSWRGCLQALVSGDYLTPAFVGLGFRDNISPPPIPGLGLTLVADDRAALVEMSWENHFDKVTSRKESSPFSEALNDFVLRSGGESGLRRRFGYVSDKLSDDAWLPLLALNSTSVNTGTRIIVSDLISTSAVLKSGSKNDRNREAIYPAAFDLFEMLSTPCPSKWINRDACQPRDKDADGETRLVNGADISLSTAAMLSARFPIVSPAGVIRSKARGDLGDRGVDGGYFENAGLTTALDVARALRSRGLTPVVLWIQNDPSCPTDDPDCVSPGSPSTFPPRAADSPRLATSDATGLEAVFGVVATPFNALTATREGHSMEEDSAVERYLDSLNERTPAAEQGPNFITFKAYKYPKFQPQKGEVLWHECEPFVHADPMVMSEVSMSWWLSQAVQAEIDAQLCDYRNRRSLNDLMNRLSQQITFKNITDSVRDNDATQSRQ